MTNEGNAIGGYFELELPPIREALYVDAMSFQSARSALLALLRAQKVGHVWVPLYICDAMLAPFRATGTRLQFYSLSNDFEIVEDIQLGENDWVVYVNYFGICTEAAQRVVKKYGKRVVCDHAQAFFAAPEQCLATIYSPRKFFGVPDGGLLVTHVDVESPTIFQDVTLQSVAHLIKRLSIGAEGGYADYVAAEKSFDDIEPRMMSAFAKRILFAVDMSHVATKRQENFNFLHSNLSPLNRLHLHFAEATCVPLCYPFLPASSSLREHLRSRRIFTATYWPEVLARSTSGSFEAEMANKLVAIPCDQRYEKEDLQRIVDVISRPIAELK